MVLAAEPALAGNTLSQIGRGAHASASGNNKIANHHPTNLDCAERVRRMAALTRAKPIAPAMEDRRSAP